MDLSYRQERIQAKRKQTSWRDFVRDKMSRKSLNYNKVDGLVSRFPQTDRIPPLLSITQLNDIIDTVSTTYHLDYDPNYTFFQQIQQLFSLVPQPALIHYTPNEGSGYSDCVLNSKNAYLSSTVVESCENILYSMDVRYDSNNIYNSLIIYPLCENVYYSVGIAESTNIFYSKYIVNSNNIWFSMNCTGCSECILCNNLDNSSYYIQNKQYSKEEYHILKDKLLIQKEKFESILTQMHQSGNNVNSEDVTGSSIKNSIAIEHGYFVYGLKNARNVALVGSNEGDENFFDTFLAGRGKDYYGLNDCGGFSANCYLSSHLTGCNTVYYCYYLTDCSFCLGCISLKNKSYCILNKQYTKEERYIKVDEIFTQMEKDGQLGEFFPATMNPFYFNDTSAYLIDNSFTKEEVTAKGYLRRDEPIKVDIPDGVKVIKTSDLDKYEGRITDTGEFVSVAVMARNESAQKAITRQRYIDSDILKVIIQDDQGNIYKIVKMEYDFLMKYGLPLPSKHWLDRMKENFKI